MTTDTPTKSTRAGGPKAAATKVKKAPAPKKAAPKKAAASKKDPTKKAAAPKPSKKAPAPKTSKPAKPGFGSKTAFIKSQPKSMTAKEVVAAAKAKGITLSENLVYSVKGAKKAGASKKGTVKAKPGPKPKAKVGSGDSLEVTLRNAIAQIGLNRARQIFDEVERVFTGG